MTFTISFIVYTLFIIAVGLFSARYARRSDEDYFLAGRSLGPWVAALSASASSESGWVTLGLVGWAFAFGYSAYWIIPGCLLGFIFNWFVVAGRLRDRSRALESLTLPDFFAFNYRERYPILRVLSVLVIIVAMVLYVAAQFGAAGKSFAAAFDNLNYQAGVLIGAAIVLAYVVLGGFRAACWTDFIQALIMVGTLVVFPIYLIATTDGGFGGLRDTLTSAAEQADFTSFSAIDAGDPAAGEKMRGLLPPWIPQAAQASTAALIGFLLGHGALGINFGYPGQPHVLVRFKALRERKEAVIGGVISCVWAILIYWGAVTIGLIVRAKAIEGAPWAAVLEADLNPENLGAGDEGLVLAAKNLIEYGILSGLVLAAVLAAICSTADSQLVVATSSAANDLYSRLADRQRRVAHLLVNRVTLVVLCVIAVLIVIGGEIPIFGFVLKHGWAVLGASFGPQMILCLLWRRASYAGCVAGMAVGFTLALAWPLIYDPQATGVEVYNLPLAFICAMVVNVLVSLAFPSKQPAEASTP
ncbi:MAG: sodium/proline symporter [Phycisphaerales bacterium]|nr:MAG: sodium/proline symporter [Phycisphaerales bacterium]